MPPQKTKAEFIEPMFVLRTERLPEGPNWLCELKLDGEVVALDEKGRPSFNALQNCGQGEPLHFFIFDLLILRGRDVMAEPLLKRRALIEKHVLPMLADPIR